MKNYYKQLRLTYPKNRNHYFNLPVEEIEKTFQQADEYLLEERKSIDATIRQLESLRKK